ncbi:hypothetical protein V6R86_01805 [Sphingomonas kaistensis]|uniref:Uncharacterized protein n=1 Tax=Sphingomonas kaistensis TaxID=298708 RepID=A0ABZ2FZ22_9SPHN
MRLDLDSFYREFLPVGASVESIPLKPLGFAVKPLKVHSSPRRATARAVAALAAAAAASSCKLQAGEKVPRRLAQPAGVVENGAASDLLRAGLATPSRVGPLECFELTREGVEAIRKTIPQDAQATYFGKGECA